MFIVDASAVLHALVGNGGGAAFDLIVSGDAVAPHVLDVEVLHGLRKFVREGTIGAARGREAIADFQTFPIERYSRELLLPRMWELRENVTAYDASYVALAEQLSAPLITRDHRLSQSRGHTATIQYID